MNKPYYCDYAGVPTIVGETRAWSFVDGAWKEINRIEAYTQAQLISEQEFRQLFVDCHRCPHQFRADECPLLAQSGHSMLRRICPLSGAKRTSFSAKADIVHLPTYDRTRTVPRRSAGTNVDSAARARAPEGTEWHDQDCAL